jgi:serine/threonine protein kinase
MRSVAKGANDGTDQPARVALAGRYRIERELGGGGMSRVFVATETALGREVVIKAIKSDLAEGLSFERFAHEVKLAARLQQANTGCRNAVARVTIASTALGAGDTTAALDALERGARGDRPCVRRRSHTVRAEPGRARP